MADVIVVGSYVQDLSFRTESFPAPGETRLGDFLMGQGGKGFNQAIACHRQEIPTLFVGAVGDDAFGAGLREFAGREEIELALEFIPDQSSGAAAILVDASGQNQIIVDTGANGALTRSHIRSLKSRFDECEVVVIQAECNLEAAALALELGAAAGARTIFNPAPVNQSVSVELLQQAEIITPNESEFIFLMKHLFHHDIDKNFWRESDETVHALCRRFEIPTVVLTLGEQGCFVSHSAAANVSTGDTPYFRAQASQVSAIDTTGAGDAFNGGLAAGLVRHPGDFKAAIRSATFVAGLSTTKAGTARAMPTRAEVERAFSDSSQDSSQGG